MIGEGYYIGNIIKTLISIVESVMTTCLMLWEWLSSPLPTEDILAFAPELAGLTPFDILLGSGLIFILTFAIIKFITK